MNEMEQEIRNVADDLTAHGKQFSHGEILSASSRKKKHHIMTPNTSKNDHYATYRRYGNVGIRIFHLLNTRDNVKYNNIEDDVFSKISGEIIDDKKENCSRLVVQPGEKELCLNRYQREKHFGEIDTPNEQNKMIYLKNECSLLVTPEQERKETGPLCSLRLLNEQELVYVLQELKKCYV